MDNSYNFRYLLANDNCIIVSNDSMLFINVYLPSTRSEADVDKLQLIIEDIVTVVNSSNWSAIILGGDLNCNILSNSTTSVFINSQLRQCGLKPTYDFINEINNKTFTFNVAKRNAFSLIDFFFIKGFSANELLSYEIIDSITNSSDHCPIRLSIDSPIFMSLLEHPAQDSERSTNVNFQNIFW